MLERHLDTKEDELKIKKRMAQFMANAVTQVNMHCKEMTDKLLFFEALSGLHTANLSWQTRVGKLQKVGKLVPSHVKLMANKKTRQFPTWPLFSGFNHVQR